MFAYHKLPSWVDKLSVELDSIYFTQNFGIVVKDMLKGLESRYIGVDRLCLHYTTRGREEW